MAKMPKNFEKSKMDMKKDAKKGMPKEGSKKEEAMDRKMIAKAAGGGMMMPAKSNKGGAMRGLDRAAAMSGRTFTKGMK